MTTELQPSKNVTAALALAVMFYGTLLVGIEITSRLNEELSPVHSSPLSFLVIISVSLVFIAATGLSRGWSSLRLDRGKRLRELLRSSTLAFGLFLGYLVVVILPIVGFVYAYGGSLRVDWLRAPTSLAGLVAGLLSALFVYSYVIRSLLQQLRGLRGILIASFTALPLNAILWGTAWHLDQPMALIFIASSILPTTILLVHLVLKLKNSFTSALTFALINWRFYWIGFRIPPGQYEPYIDAAVTGIASYLLLTLTLLLTRTQKKPAPDKPTT